MLTDPRVERFAPMLRFASDERHFPIDPCFFVARARLRRFGWSRTMPDGFWNPSRLGWDGGVGVAPPAHATSPDLSRACALMQSEAPSRPGAGRNRRPNDPANLWGGQCSGYGLELTQAFARELRGVPGSAPFLLYDRYRMHDADTTWDVISYWFFYSLHVSAQPHEGDWSSVSVLLPTSGSSRPVVRLGGLSAGLDDIEVADETHPVLYVQPGSHATLRSPSESDGASFPLLLRTWRLTPRPVQEMSWSSFDGAWGRVGAQNDTTGPLGPLMRRLTVPLLAGRPAA